MGKRVCTALLTTKCHLILVCRLVRCLNKKSIREKFLQPSERTKPQEPGSIQNTASCKLRRIQNDSREAWQCFMCYDIVKEDMIKCQVCFRWAHGAIVQVWATGLTFLKLIKSLIKKITFVEHNYHVDDVSWTPPL